MCKYQLSILTTLLLGLAVPIAPAAATTVALTLGEPVVTETLGSGSAPVEFTFTVPANTIEQLISSTPPAADAIYYDVYFNNTLVETGNNAGGLAFDHRYSNGSFGVQFHVAGPATSIGFQLTDPIVALTPGLEVTERLLSNQPINLTFSVPSGVTEWLHTSTPPKVEDIYYLVYFNNTLVETGNNAWVG
jgi:hypothetical protein